MGKAARAIIIKDDKILVMHRNKYGSQYFTLVGGQVNEGETIEQALVREIKEESGLNITEHRLVFIEKHPEPYNEQYVFICKVAPHDNVSIQESSEEGWLNKLDGNIHKPVWVSTNSFHTLQFRTPQLYQAILDGLKNGFPSEPKQL